MKDEEKRIKKLISDELDAEAKKTISEVEADMTLKDIALPGDMDGQLAAKIQEYEKQQANYRLLSEEDKEALRLGREMLAQRGDDGEEAENKEAENKEATKVVKFRKRRRMAVLLVATVGVMILGFGMTSIGGKPFLTETVKRILGGREQIVIEPKDTDIAETNNISEDNIWASIQNELGFEPVKLRELPVGTSFSDGQVDKKLQEAWMLYEYGGNLIEYRIFVNYTDKTLGYDMEDKLIEKYTIMVNENKVEVKKYRIEESGDEQYMAYFKDKNVHYIISASIEKDIFEEIIKNLKISR